MYMYMYINMYIYIYILNKYLSLSLYIYIYMESRGWILRGVVVYISAGNVFQRDFCVELS